MSNPAEPHFDFDLIVIGSGPAGQRAALQGSKAGKRVAIVEEYNLVGGGCVHFGTLPSKSFRESVYRFSLGSRGTLGQEAEHHDKPERRHALPDMSRLLRRKERVVSGESQVIYDQLKRNQIEMIPGRGRFVGLNAIEVGGRTITGAFIFIGVGARPVSPPNIPVDGRVLHDSNTILTLRKTPKSMIVLGAGIIGCEFASMFSTAGTRVYLIDKRHEILASVDREVVNHLVERFTAQDMQLMLACEAVKIDQVMGRGRLRFGRPIGARVHLSNGKKISAEVVLVAQGRAGNTEGLNLDVVGIKTDERGLIKVNDHFQTSVSHIYAVGDVVGAPALASTSMEQGRIACCHAFGIPGNSGGAKLENDRTVEQSMPTLFPYGIYTIPEISMLGKTEEELIQRKADFVVGRARYRELARGQIVGDRWGILKLLVDRKTLKLLGVHIIGDNAADLIHIGQAVMAFDGDVNYFISSVFNYPTLAEAYKTAAFHAVNQINGTTKTR